MDLANRGVNFATLQLGNIDFEPAGRIFGQSDFIRRRTSRYIYHVRLAHHRYNRAGIGPDTIAIIGAARGVDVKTCEYLGGRAVEAKNNLDVAIRVLC